MDALFMMNKWIVVAAVFFCLSFSLLGKEVDSDSLIFIDELVFDTDFEKKSFMDFVDKGEKGFELFMSIGNRLDAKKIGMDKNMFNTEVSKLKAISVPAKKEKYYKTIYSDVHNRFLKKYEIENYFADVLTDGKYNCVSACGLYALIFDQLNISYAVKQTPTHVYLVIEPNSDQFLIETTDPVGGFNKFSQGFKSNFTKNLADGKLIDTQEYNSKDPNELFNKYYFTKDNLGLKELIAYQYFNHGLFLLEKNLYNESAEAMQKSYFLHPDKKIYTSLLYTQIQKQSKQNFEKKEDVHSMVILSRFKESEISDGILIDEFIRITKEVYIDKGKSYLYDHIYFDLVQDIKRPNVKSEIEFIYNHEKGRILLNKGSVNESYDYIKKAFELKPENADVEALFLHLLGMIIQSSTNGSMVAEQLDQLIEEFPVLVKNNKFGGVYLNAILWVMFEKYSDNKLQDGNWYRESFEQKLKEHPYYLVDKMLIGRAYSQLAVYHFRKGQYSSARTAINKGLELSPNNNELLGRLRMLSN